MIATKSGGTPNQRSVSEAETIENTRTETMPYNYPQLDSHASATPKAGTTTSTYPPKVNVNTTKVKNPKAMVKKYK